MMDHLILHDATRAQLLRFVERPAHALLITGPAGIGKTAVAEGLVSAVLGTQLGSHPYYLQVRPNGNSISIESVRELQKFLLLKTTGEQAFRRAVMVEYAHALTTEAQNALLKLLEEPPADTLLVLTANSPRALLPTILSRAQTITIHTPTEMQLQAILENNGKSDEARKQAYFLSGGLPGLLYALLHEEDHPLAVSVARAKALLQKQPFERLALVEELSKRKEEALGVVEALERIAQAGVAGAGTRRDTTRIKQWHKVRKASLEACAALSRSANAKLVLDTLCLEL